MGDIEYCAWSSFRRSFLRIQPLTWYPKDSGGSLRLGALARVLTGTHEYPVSAGGSLRLGVLAWRTLCASCMGAHCRLCRRRDGGGNGAVQAGAHHRAA